MFYTYILFCKKTNKLYTGYSSDLKRRLKEHQTGKVHSTRRLGECQLIFYEAFMYKEDALNREKYLKTTNGKRTLKIMLKNAINNLRSPIVP